VDTAGTSKVRGTVLRVVQQKVRDTDTVQAVVQTDTGIITCMWRSVGMAHTVAENTAYTFRGHLQDIQGRKVMVEPHVGRVPAAAPFNPSAAFNSVASKAPDMTPSTAANTAPPTNNPANFKGLQQPVPQQKSRKKQLIVAAAVVVVGLGVALPLSLSSHKDAPGPVKAAVNAPLSIDQLPAAYDAAGKAIPATPDDCDVAVVPFNTTDKNDASLPFGQIKIKQVGVNGQDKLCYVHGRDHFPVTITLKKAINQVRLVGTKK
jgi:hypothetical protein